MNNKIRVPWNKGLKGFGKEFGFKKGNKYGSIHKGRKKEKYDYLKRISEHHKDNGNPIWKGGTSQSYLYKKANEYNLKKGVCSWCKNKKRTVVHHKDGDRTNNKRSNLIEICQTCHVRKHKPRKGTGKKNRQIL